MASRQSSGQSHPRAVRCWLAPLAQRPFGVLVRGETTASVVVLTFADGAHLFYRHSSSIG